LQAVPIVDGPVVAAVFSRSRLRRPPRHAL
jgi:hypothetical protein